MYPFSAISNCENPGERYEITELRDPTPSLYFRLQRYDLTDFMRSLSDGASNPSYRFEFDVKNTIMVSGLIMYFSYDYVEEDPPEPPEPSLYHYNFPMGLSERHLTMPFYAIDFIDPHSPSHAPETPTLFKLFGHRINYARMYKNSSGVLDQILLINEELRGDIGDSVRTFSFKVNFYINPESYDIEGWPVYEQRYLDYNNNNDLWFGTVTDPARPIRFTGNLPDDYPNNKIYGDRTVEWAEVDGITGPITPVDYIITRRAYDTSPAGGPLPYSLDLDAGYGHYAVWGMEGGKNEYLFIEYGYSIDAEIFEEGECDSCSPEALEAYYEYLRSIENLPGIGTWHTYEFGKRGTYSENIQYDFKLTVQPNPFNSSVSIIVPEEAIISISDVNGRLVEEFEVIGGNISWQPTEELPSGIYYIRASFRDGIVNSRVVMLK